MVESAEIGVISIATNRYFDYWLDLVKSAYDAIESDKIIDFYLFTDQTNRKNEVCSYEDKFRFTFINIPSYGWPAATLKRYELIKASEEALINPILMYLDSDMLIRKDFTILLREILQDHSMVLVSHPGYFRPNGIKKLLFYANYFPFALRDFKMRVLTGGIGAWEKRKISSAYVIRRDRKLYVCGGAWFGRRESFLSLVSDLFDLVTEDENRGIVAIWHDESYLNKYATIKSLYVSDPRYCADPRYPNLRSIPILIEAVNKNET